ncbi:hypothetical protein S83_041213 [Arachis hypogaea]|nr:uncharacterized protein DS421_13g394130 [Arachis hypogaea]
MMISYLLSENLKCYMDEFIIMIRRQYCISSSRSTAASLPLPRSACRRRCISHFVQIRALPLRLLLRPYPRAATRLLLRSNLPSPLRLLLHPDLRLSPLLPLHDVHGRLFLFLFEFVIAVSFSTLVLLFSQFALHFC